MFSELVAWKAEAAKAAGRGPELFPWIEGIMNEGFLLPEDDLGQVGAAAAATAPMETLQWAAEMAVKLSNDLDQQQRVTSQQGFQAAQNWAKEDPEGLSQWLLANRDHLAYDTGAAAIYKTLLDSDPHAAAAWGAEIQDISLRQWVKLEP